MFALAELFGRPVCELEQTLPWTEAVEWMMYLTAKADDRKHQERRGGRHRQ